MQRLESINIVNGNFCYSICTNANYRRILKEENYPDDKKYIDDILDYISKSKKFHKFTISLDYISEGSSDVNNYCNKYGIPNPNPRYYARVKEFIEILNNKNIKYSVNLVPDRSFLENYSSYMEGLKKLGVEDFSITKPLFISEDNAEYEISDKELIILFNKIANDSNLSGFLDNFELLLPSCEKNCEAKERIMTFENGEFYNYCKPNA